MTTPNKIHIAPHLGVSIGVLASSTAAILIRFAQRDATSLVIAAYRLGIATLFLLPFLYFRGRQELKCLHPRRWLLAAIAGAFLALHFITWISSLEYTSVASSVIIVSTAPIFVSILSPLLLKEPIHHSLRYGILLSLIGSLIIGLSDHCTWQGGLYCPPFRTFVEDQSIQGDLLALAGAITAAGYLLVGRHSRGHISLLPYISITYGTAAIILIGLVLMTGERVVGFPADTYLWLLLLALVPQLIGHNTINWALKYLSAAYVSVTLLGEPIASTIWAYLLLGERPSGFMLLGAFFVLTGIGVASLLQPASSVKLDVGERNKSE
jgi:drug/metabolite transporter (DMT)-like permease